MLLKILRIALPFAFGYFLSYFLRGSVGIIVPDIEAEVPMTQTQWGLIGGAYFFTFALMQIPVGLLLDRIGPRRVEAALLLFAVLGAFLFGIGQSFTELYVGRALVGIGVSACLMASFTAFAHWFPKDKLAALNAIIMTAGSLGAISSTEPYRWAVNIIGWRATFDVLAVAVLVSAVLIFFVVPKREEQEAKLTVRELLGGLKEVFTSIKFWKLAPVGFTSQAMFLVLQNLWLAQWLRHVRGADETMVAQSLEIMAAAQFAGFIFQMTLTPYLARRGISSLALAALGLVFIMVGQMGLIVNPAIPVWPMVAILGVGGSLVILAYAGLTQQFPVALAGRANTSLNLLVFLSIPIIKWFVGVVLDAFDNVPVTLADGSTQMAPPLEAYQWAFGLIWILQALSLAWFWAATRIQKGATQEESTQQ